ncbi:phenylalanine--tRNA ligase subunit beta [Viridibacillus sp. FSL R5-0477]|uniref:Phenylalanine--tRNA ligase beta subunit n=1 Tax=Viridibacillus arenosi FSL R5-213 TaxID=1227360 RepID=W4ERY8_9BACL|nr:MULTISPECIES: phenylalanine--tRNA ligase subunit beta [Viridibacillus]ETT82556.1 phenylalanyl-tRNA synthetase subunit beta [Viridibacillus arenosi FSL R5-213]OMC85524.1 phenylalanine--tRNA ligase subunit beta [Viridibacillus sp. FSL H8-0123]OMC87201.1 phenylalanine--tRNA ligase subunit beta [Viridibacillus sp. FSL H7-0596]OMC92361.1 phenylalanine--tRNA ligase subunit beta [Viridibacillus arenosi]
MLVSLKWLEQYVDLQGLEPAVLAEKITRSGIEVDGVANLAEGMKKLMVGEVKEKVKHPEADKLNICQVDFGEEELSQIVCGAPNVAVGQKVIVARPGAHLPGGKIKKAKLRGEVSNGMICSLQELGIEGKLVPKAYSEGIFVLPAETPVGADPLEVLGLYDTVLELGLTPNRSDAMSMLGVAYEVGAILSEDVKLPELDYTESTEKASDYLKLRVDAPVENPMYVAKVVKNVKVAESPLWLQQRLMAAGVRPHNNVVDVTNYILMEYGQPLHAFDYDRLGTGEIVVRLANEGEKITTLDDKERTLNASNLVITNAKEPVAVAGVMGGLNSEVHEGTTTVVIESAYFEGLSVRYTSKDLGLRSDASARFEKGLDPNRVIPAAERAAKLLAELAGGEVLAGSVMFDELDKTPAKVIVSPDFINARLGMKISLDDMVSILKRLKFDVETANGMLYVDAPTRRQDIKIEEDIVEEIARIYGYDEIPTTLPVSETTPGGLTPYQAKRRIVRAYLEGAGLHQAITYSLTSDALSQKFALETAPVTKLLMPMSEERSTLRQSLIPHLVEAASYNVARQADLVALYEVDSVFLGLTEESLPHEEEHVAAVITGKWLDHAWQGEHKQVDFFVLKGIVEGLFDRLGLADAVTFERATLDGLHPGRTANVLLNGNRIGLIAQLHPTEQKANGLKETYVMEMNLAAILEASTEALVYVPVPRFPSMSRDIALVVDRSVAAADLEVIIRQAGGTLLKDVRVFDLYEGDKMEEGKKSVAFSLQYFEPERTLTDEEVVAAHDEVLKALAEANAQIR